MYEREGSASGHKTEVIFTSVDGTAEAVGGPQQAAEKGVAAALRRHMRVAMIEVVAT